MDVQIFGGTVFPRELGSWVRVGRGGGGPGRGAGRGDLGRASPTTTLVGDKPIPRFVQNSYVILL